MNLKKYNYSINIPISFNIIIIENKINKNNLKIILYNNFYSITFTALKKKIIVDLESYCIKLNPRFSNFKENNLSFKNVNRFFKLFEFYFFIKIKFKGKGFKIRYNKKLKLIKFYFGRSHMTFYKIKKLKLKKITKYKFLLKSKDWNNLKRHAKNITRIKPVNVYTLRGIRVSRQFISKRKGKKSSYV